ncbi:MAG: transglutaminase family protein, partial [Nitrosomonas ureae]
PASSLNASIRQLRAGEALGPPRIQTETGRPSMWQRLLDFVLPTVQAVEPHVSRSSAVFRYREYVPAYARPQDSGDPLLASTPEFDLADPYLVEKANELGYDPQRIFAFVRDEIGFESYVGSLRGARGTLWSKAGNALDKASLMIALLRISGMPAQYTQGTISDTDAKTLILSMFDPVLRAQAVGYIPDEYPRADPVNDPTLLAEARSHWWVELGNGTPLDPNFKDGLIHGSQLTTHPEVPDNFRHKVTIRLKTEFNNVLSGFTEQTPLQKTLTTAEVYGKPLTISHFVNEKEVNGLIGAGYKTYTYSPYIMVDDNDASIDNDGIIRGSDYQEFFSNLFPIANSIVTRATLEIEVLDTGKTPEIYSRDFVDRVGFSARHGLAAVGSINVEQPILSELSHMTLSITPGFSNPNLIEKHKDGFLSLASNIDLMFQKITAILELPPETIVRDEDKDIVNEFT